MDNAASNITHGTDANLRTLDETTDKLFREYYVAWGGQEAITEAEIEQLPEFFHRVPLDHEIMPQKLREDARATLLEKRSHELLENEELQSLWSVLEIAGVKYISYENFKKAAQEASPKAKMYFTASTYAKLVHPDDKLSRVDILSFFNYVMKKVWMQQTRIGISLYDVTGEGYLREVDLENYILELIPSLCQLSHLERSFQTFYVCTAVRKFFFFLDPMHLGRVRIMDILASGFLDCMLELRESQTTEEQLANNWFSHQSAMRIYGSYLQLDEDRNGMLTRAELSRYGNGTLTDAFLDRVFQECITYDGEMDYKAYLDFVLAMENKREPQALAYLFRILDIGGRGRLDGITLRHFYDSMEEKLLAAGNLSPGFNDIQNEIFDMVEPVNPNYITLNDLIRCGKADTIISLLIDLQGFWSHENREMFMTELPDEAEL
ncbi:Serine/threonine-protein phosphatase 2A regulatory subunit B'' subunit gamma [Paragonimus skrjabini miyazakii]|uniref:Serine/threonine-protein phosphatase 2A regulatory subunit B'' subunit gamma n=1 Tax=Paragonimus skrjabini miyazakii TaxID=59628 RepID=A0A8S9YNJ9_9TREM|nr:Serine/threonine-protein phosphatase 2A regulatory subunit B'' subunit gamma [Paragonimus skrjabini miyazakii]